MSLLRAPRLIPVGRRRVSRKGKLYYIALPADLRELWEELRSEGAVLNVLIEVNAPPQPPPPKAAEGWGGEGEVTHYGGGE
jgi:hypothetical protein